MFNRSIHDSTQTRDVSRFEAYLSRSAVKSKLMTNIERYLKPDAQLNDVTRTFNGLNCPSSPSTTYDTTQKILDDLSGSTLGNSNKFDSWFLATVSNAMSDLFDDENNIHPAIYTLLNQVNANNDGALNELCKRHSLEKIKISLLCAYLVSIVNEEATDVVRGLSESAKDQAIASQLQDLEDDGWVIAVPEEFRMRLEGDMMDDDSPMTRYSQKTNEKLRTLLAQDSIMMIRTMVDGGQPTVSLSPQTLTHR